MVSRKRFPKTISKNSFPEPEILCRKNGFQKRFPKTVSENSFLSEENPIRENDFQKQFSG